jgi:peptidoglycan hydrolase-like protein with peptidoglycan-binding domain
MAEFDMPKTGTWEERGGWLVKRLVADLALTAPQAAGLVGNLGFESGGLKELQELGVSSYERGGYGWAQWTGPRRTQFESWCEVRSLDPASDEANYGFLVAELESGYTSVIRALKRCETVEDATWSVGQTYERPGGTTADNLPGYEGRLDYARRALAGAGDQSVKVGTITQPPSVQPTLRLGSRGPAVTVAQQALGIEADSAFGPLTEEAVKAFQTKNALTPDGVVGPLTWAKLVPTAITT